MHDAYLYAAAAGLLDALLVVLVVGLGDDPQAPASSAMGMTSSDRMARDRMPSF
ncbi:MAG TPA: hypothetical protein VME22_01560 [Solirubrobacteraceae bacterium]|nr:hypothetical protein [Solirubrobacteraceae bacterium]